LADDVMMDLPAEVAQAVAPVLDALPMTQAMGRLVVPEAAARQVLPEAAARQVLPEDEAWQVAGGVTSPIIECVEAAVADGAIVSRPALVSGLWLYVDELDRSHVVSQGIDDATGSFWHGIMHRREGDFSNSHYWFRKVGTHPVMVDIDGYDPHQLIDDVEAASDDDHGRDFDQLVALQRREWQTLFAWCAQVES
jgi:hypothetical protein